MELHTATQGLLGCVSLIVRHWSVGIHALRSNVAQSPIWIREFHQGRGHCRATETCPPKLWAPHLSADSKTRAPHKSPMDTTGFQEVICKVTVNVEDHLLKTSGIHLVWWNDGMICYDPKLPERGLSQCILKFLRRISDLSTVREKSSSMRFSSVLMRDKRKVLNVKGDPAAPMSAHRSRIPICHLFGCW